MIELESERLFIREIAADDLERWQRDWAVAQMMPGRHMLACYLKADGAAVGFAEYWEEVDDGWPWFGALTLHKAHQRQGLGLEAARRLLAHFRQDYGWPLVRAGVMEQNEAGLALARRLDFQPVERGLRRFPGGKQAYIVFERLLTD